MKRQESIDWIRERAGITLGMSKDEALEKFRLWRERMRTCQRCECDKYIDFCPFHLICMEADDVRDAEGNDNGDRVVEADGAETLRAGISETRKRASLR
jgi:hypothetical protein